MPAIYFGPGDVKAAHTVDEYVDSTSITLPVRVYERAIVEFLNSGAHR